MSSQATVTIDLDAIEQNFELVRELSPASNIMAIIKADAYGHGAVAVARKLAQANAFGVARVSEAVKLREAGVGTPICLLEGVLDKDELNLASVYELQVVVHSQYQLDLMQRHGARRQCWIKVDTGMHRLGMSLTAAEKLAREPGGPALLGFMTHLADASDPGSPALQDQLGRIEVLRAIPGVKGRLSVKNSAGIIGLPRLEADWVRPGLMLYGASPMDDLEPMSSLHPAMTFTAPVIAVNRLKAGDSVGYGGLWTAASDTSVAVIAAGYADGYPREIAPGTPVLIGDEMMPLVGRVSMDMICVQLRDGHRVAIGDRATLWGGGLPIEKIAASAGTIAYTLMSGVTSRVPRVYRGRVNNG